MASESTEHPPPPRTEEEEEARIISAAARSLPRDAVRELLSVGVCVRCIFRLFGVRGPIYSCSSLSTSVLCSVFEDDSGTERIGSPINGVVHSPCVIQDPHKDQLFCGVCLGILQFAYDQEQAISSCKKESHMNGFTASIAELVKREGHQIDGFSLEISIPPVILANERAIRLYMKRKYESETWFHEKLVNEHISVKDALKLSIIHSLENHLAIKCGVESFRIRLTYSHSKASLKLQNFSAKDSACKKRKTEYNGPGANGSHMSTGNGGSEPSFSESDAAICRTLQGLEDQVFAELFPMPPEKVSEPCHLNCNCCRMPIYICGRYMKYSRKVSQTCWMVDGERIGEASVEEIIGSNVLPVCKGDSYKFHAAGREDIDVRMLGSGRPFLVEVLNARISPSLSDIQAIADKINNSENHYVEVKNLKIVDSQVWTLMREGEAEKQKQYAALVWISRPLEETDLQKISSIKELDILQNTPIRVLHRRSPMERKRMIHWMETERITGSCQYFLLHLCTQAGTYIKEFVHGDLGRTQPNIGTILGCRAEIVQLDVTDVKMDSFD
ncbi:hypothetical protein QJS10_CPA03g02363 [Acorus calamus]|uniref:tRNA pseudouridine(55) synthase n=1 Tax=Acorus calamus TaxID=4465 RepID=A0AAV9F7A0_ACOCL|nr:hypothetical protein QJS10_CPA03g02363 [Acorus calamus]